MKRLHQLISCCLALGFALAGAIGINPVLHQLIEHGGHGPAHTHSAMMASANALSVWHDDGDGRLHQHLLRPPAPTQTRLQRPFAHSHEFELPAIPVGRLLHAFSQLLETGSSNPAGSVPSDNPAGHQHHSLPQMLLTGLLDQHLEVQPSAFRFAPVVFLAPVAEVLPLARDWDAQTQGRAPPTSWS